MQISVLKNVSLTVILWRRSKSKDTAECGHGAEPGLYGVRSQIKLTLTPCMEALYVPVFPRRGRDCCESEVSLGLRVRLCHKTEIVPISERFPGDMWDSRKENLEMPSNWGHGWSKREGSRKKLLKWLFLWSARCPVQGCPPLPSASHHCPVAVTQLSKFERRHEMTWWH